MHRYRLAAGLSAFALLIALTPTAALAAVETEWHSLAVERSAALDDPIPCIGDGTSGKRVEVIYAVPSDVSNSYGSYVDDIRMLVSNVNREMSASAGETRGRRQLRLVTDGGCNLIVRNVALPTANANTTFESVVADLTNQGYSSSDRIYLVYLHGQIPACGTANNGYAVMKDSCWADVDDHELMHSLGTVVGSAPHGAGGGHCSDKWDPMCVTPAPPTFSCQWWHHDIYDCGHNDYFHTNPKAGSFLDKNPFANAANSPFLAALKPLNDDFADAEPVQKGVIWGSNVGATTETGEPTTAGDGSVWYRLNASAGQTVRFTTFGSSSDTVLGVYTGGAVSSLTKVKSNDDVNDKARWSSVTFTAPDTNTYFARVVSKEKPGSVRLNASLGDKVPVITGFSPKSGPPGTTVHVTGDWLHSTGPEGFVVTINGLSYDNLDVVADGITVDVGRYATSGPITFAASQGQTATIGSFKLLPKIYGFSPGQASPGDVVSVDVGGNYSKILPKFWIKDHSAKFLGYDGTGKARIKVPSGAETGRIKVKTSSGSDTSAAQLTIN